ncbi:MAG: serine hydrolase [Spirochaetales bacterium]|jgi:CubicO group peptidase (beta-lactamase class C family)|nr:serine hydrolase [Spirochaetales bacterium]
MGEYMESIDIDGLMRQAVSDNIFPGGQLLVSHAGRIIFNRAYGLANIYTGRPVTHDTLFDLASLTKPLATTLAVMILMQEEKLSLAQGLSSILPGFCNTPKAEIQIQHLLYHISGLPDYRPYYIDINNLSFDRRKDALRNRLISEPLVSEIGKTTRYSDIGFMLLEWVIEQTSGKGLDTFVREKVYEPLGVKDLFYIARHQNMKEPLPDKNFAATEFCPWRQKLISGQVHDDNAYVMGGVAGQAGLFGTSESVHAILAELFNAFYEKSSKQIFRSDVVHLFLQKKASHERTLGFDTPSPRGSSSGELFDRQYTVGHLGFTGTSFWMDLKQQVIVILLTNRIHPSRKNDRIRKFRPLIHNQVMHGLKSHSLV